MLYSLCIILAVLLQLDFQARRRAIIKGKHAACIILGSCSQQAVQQPGSLGFRHVFSSAQAGLVTFMPPGLQHN